MKWTATELRDVIHEFIKLLIILSLTASFMGVVFVILYGVMFVTQPMSGQSPNDKAMFAILTPLAIFLPTIINQIWQTLNNEKHEPLPPSMTQAYNPPTPPAPPAPMQCQGQRVGRMEPMLEPMAAAPVVTGFGGKPAPPPAHQPEID
jgi:hypothetical protein